MIEWTPLGNDTEADCVIAAAGHAIQLWTGTPPTMAEVERAYQKDCGGGPGCNYLTVLWKWFWSGIGGHRLRGFAPCPASAVDASVRRYGCLYAGIRWPEVGDHCVLVLASSPDAVTFVTWGREVTVARADFNSWLTDGYSISNTGPIIWPWLRYGAWWLFCT
jgi:hypothetical protein